MIWALNPFSESVTRYYFILGVGIKKILEKKKNILLLHVWIIIIKKEKKTYKIILL